MKLEKLFLPLSIFAAVIAVYVFFRGQGGASTLTFPSTSSSGVPEAATSQGQVQPINYSVAAQPVNIPPVVALSQPNNPNPGGVSNGTPAYLNYNLGAGNLLNSPPIPFTPPDANCGCGSGCGSCANQCGQQNSYSDGSGQTQLVSTRTKQSNGADTASWQPTAIQNLNAYLALENSDAGTPNVASWMPGGMIQ
jgi:hypothetical protein